MADVAVGVEEGATGTAVGTGDGAMTDVAVGVGDGATDATVGAAAGATVGVRAVGTWVGSEPV